MNHLNTYEILSEADKAWNVLIWDLEEMLTPEELHGFLLGNAIKYLTISGKRGRTREDLAMARLSLDTLIHYIDEETCQTLEQ